MIGTGRKSISNTRYVDYHAMNDEPIAQQPVGILEDVLHFHDVMEIDDMERENLEAFGEFERDYEGEIQLIPENDWDEIHPKILQKIEVKFPSLRIILC